MHLELHDDEAVARVDPVHASVERSDAKRVEGAPPGFDHPWGRDGWGLAKCGLERAQSVGTVYADSDTNSNPNPNPNPNPNTNPNSDPDTDSNPDPNPNANPNANPDPNPDSNPDPNPNPNPNPKSVFTPL